MSRRVTFSTVYLGGIVAGITCAIIGFWAYERKKQQLMQSGDLINRKIGEAM